MATISYTFVSRCDGGGHTTFDISVNGGTARRVVFDTDDIRSPLSQLKQSEREAVEAMILRIHFAGKTRAQIVSELQSGPIGITI